MGIDRSQGELALKFGFDKDGQLQIEGYLEPKDGMAFGSDELNTAYLLASKESVALNEDTKAAQLLQGYAAIRPNPEKGTKNGEPTYEVFTFEEGDSSTGSKARKAKTNRGKHSVDPEVRCVCCQFVDWMDPENGGDSVSENSQPQSAGHTSVRESDRVRSESQEDAPSSEPISDPEAESGKLPTMSSFAGKKYKPVCHESDQRVLFS